MVKFFDKNTTLSHSKRFYLIWLRLRGILFINQVAIDKIFER